jgi:hypothetical protein
VGGNIIAVTLYQILFVHAVIARIDRNSQPKCVCVMYPVLVGADVGAEGSESDPLGMAVPAGGIESVMLGML